MRTANDVSGGKAPGLAQTMLFGRNPVWTIVRICIWVVALVLGSRFVILPVRVQGTSMMPTYKETGVNFIYKFAYARHSPQRGDVVAIRYAGEHVMLLKRIIGLPGETVAFEDGRVLINGQPLNEPYLKLSSNWNSSPLVVGPDEYFVVGDNRSMPKEDHTFGRARRERIVGRAML